MLMTTHQGGKGRRVRRALRNIGFGEFITEYNKQGLKPAHPDVTPNNRQGYVITSSNGTYHGDVYNPLKSLDMLDPEYVYPSNTAWVAGNKTLPIYYTITLPEVKNLTSFAISSQAAGTIGGGVKAFDIEIFDGVRWVTVFEEAHVQYINEFIGNDGDLNERVYFVNVFDVNTDKIRIKIKDAFIKTGSYLPHIRRLAFFGK